MPNDADRAGTPAGVFGAELRFYRTRAGLSQKDLAARANVSHDVISKIETGERPPAEDFQPRLDVVPELDTRGCPGSVGIVRHLIGILSGRAGRVSSQRASGPILFLTVALARQAVKHKSGIPVSIRPVTKCRHRRYDSGCWQREGNGRERRKSTNRRPEPHSA